MKSDRQRTSTNASPFRGLGVVMMDLFLSAAAALMVVLAVLSDDRPQPLPIQADVFAYCGGVASEELMLVSAAEVSINEGGLGAPFEAVKTVTNVENLTDFLQSSGSTGLLMVFALVKTTTSAVTTPCLAKFHRLFGQYRQELLFHDNRRQYRPMISLVMAAHRLDLQE